MNINRTMLPDRSNAHARLANDWAAHINAAVLKTLMQIGYLAAGDSRFADARTIFAGVIAARPLSEHPWLGLVVTEMNAGRLEAAEMSLRQAEQRNPDSAEVAAFADALRQLRR